MKTFKNSCLAGIFYHIFLFAFSMGCGYFTSALLDVAMEENVQAALASALDFLLILIFGLPVIYFWRKKLGRILRADRQAFRETLYRDIIERRILVESTGELDVRLSNDADTVAEYYQSAVPAFVEGLGIMLGAAVLLCRAHFVLGLLLFALSLMQLLPSIVYEKWAKEIYEQTDDAEEDYDSWLIQGSDGLTALKAGGREDWFAKKLDEISDGMVLAGYRAERTGAVETIVSQLVDGLLRYGSYVLIGIFVLYGGLKISDTPVLVVLSSYLFSSVGKLLEALQKRFEYQAASGHLAHVKLPERKTENGILLEVSHLHKAYGEKNLFSDISFTVRAGERVLIRGANGSGKSTLLRVIMGVLAADGGSVSLGSQKIAFALQEEAALTLTGDELAGDMREENAVNQKVLSEYLEGFGITAALAGKPLCEWSMGERRKFYLAAAFARGGELLILDEPTNHLDADALEYLYRKITDYPGAVLVVSHLGAIPVKWHQTIFMEGGGRDEKQCEASDRA